MAHYQEVKCPHCEGTALEKNGKSTTGKQRYKCKTCSRYFITDYSYNAYKPGLKSQIDEMLVNSSGTRDISRVLKISVNTVSRHIKKNFKSESQVRKRAKNSVCGFAISHRMG